MEETVVYGADWCPLTKRTLAHLDQIHIPYRYVNVDNDPQASEWVKQQNNGKELKPTVSIFGKILAEPTNSELDAVVRANRT